MSNMNASGLKRASFSEKLKAYGTKMKASRKDGQERREMMAQYEEHKMKSKNQWKQGEEISLQNQLSKKERQITKIKDELTYIRSKPLHEIEHTVTMVPGETPADPAPRAPTPPPPQLPLPIVSSVKEVNIASAVDNIGAKVPIEGEEVVGPELPSQGSPAPSQAPQAPLPPLPPSSEGIQTLPQEGRIAKLSRESESNKSLASAQKVEPMGGILEEKEKEGEGIQGEMKLQELGRDLPPVQEDEGRFLQQEGQGEVPLLQQEAASVQKFKIPVVHGGK